MAAAHWERDMVSNGWDGKKDEGKFQEQRRKKDWSEIQKASKAVSCALSEWWVLRGARRRSTREGTQVVLISFYGIEQRMRKEEMVEQFNRETKQGWRFCS